MVTKLPMIFPSGLPSKRSNDDISFVLGSTRIAERNKFWDAASKPGESGRLARPASRYINYDQRQTGCSLEGFAVVQPVFWFLHEQMNERISFRIVSPYSLAVTSPFPPPPLPEIYQYSPSHSQPSSPRPSFSNEEPSLSPIAVWDSQPAPW